MSYKFLGANKIFKRFFKFHSKFTLLRTGRNFYLFPVELESSGIHSRGYRVISIIVVVQSDAFKLCAGLCLSSPSQPASVPTKMSSRNYGQLVIKNFNQISFYNNFIITISFFIVRFQHRRRRRQLCSQKIILNCLFYLLCCAFDCLSTKKKNPDNHPFGFEVIPSEQSWKKRKLWTKEREKKVTKLVHYIERNLWLVKAYN